MGARHLRSHLYSSHPHEGNMEAEEARIYRLRIMDLAAGVVLLSLGIAMTMEAISYPLTESYAGVENAWYVSPALLPLIVSGCIIVLSIVLLFTAVSYVGVRRQEAGKTQRIYSSDQWVSFVFIFILLASFIYLYIPSTDFLATVILFLFLFMVAFNMPSVVPKIQIVVIYLVIGIGLRVSQLILPSRVWIYQYVRDLIIFIVYISVLVFSLMRVKRQNLETSKWVVVVVTSFVFSCFLVVSFKFGLRIPMPQEGFFCYQLETAFYSIK